MFAAQNRINPFNVQCRNRTIRFSSLHVLVLLQHTLHVHGVGVLVHHLHARVLHVLLLLLVGIRGSPTVLILKCISGNNYKIHFHYDEMS